MMVLLSCGAVRPQGGASNDRRHASHGRPPPLTTHRWIAPMLKSPATHLGGAVRRSPCAVGVIELRFREMHVRLDVSTTRRRSQLAGMNGAAFASLVVAGATLAWAMRRDL